MTENFNELHLFLGRVEGKLDAAIASQTTFARRLDRIDSSHIAIAERLSALETRRATGKDWLAIMISLGSLIAVGYGNLRGLFH